MLGMIILCLEKVNILFNQTDGEWVAISRHFLETGIQGVQMEIRFCFFFFPLDFLGDWNPLMRSEGCTEPLENSWDGECGDFSSLGFLTLQMPRASLPSLSRQCGPDRWGGRHPPRKLKPAAFLFQGSTRETLTTDESSSAVPRGTSTAPLDHCPGDKSVLVLEANSGISAQGFPEVCQKGQEI